MNSTQKLDFSQSQNSICLKRNSKSLQSDKVIPIEKQHSISSSSSEPVPKEPTTEPLPFSRVPTKWIGANYHKPSTQTTPLEKSESKPNDFSLDESIPKFDDASSNLPKILSPKLTPTLTLVKVDTKETIHVGSKMPSIDLSPHKHI